MAEYSQEERLNELSQIFRGHVDPVKTGGRVDPEQIHAQIIEIAKTVFLLNPGGIFYLAALVRNSLLLSIRQEVAIVEDMLIAVDDLSAGVQQSGGIGGVSVDDLSNAETALLALEFADTVSDRPELIRFQKIMDKFTGLYRQNVMDQQGRFILPRGEARDVLRTNMQNLTTLHDGSLNLIDWLLELIDQYNDLDVPSQVSQTALINIRTSLIGMRESIEASTSEELIANSRLIVLRALASKVGAALLAQFDFINIAAPVLTSDNLGSARDPDAPGGPFLAQAVGEGTPAQIITTPGPWILDDLDSGFLSIKVDGEAIAQDFDLSVVQGPGLHGKNAAPYTDAQLYPVWPGPPVNDPPYSGGPNDPPPPPREDFLPKPNLHFIVDATEYVFQATEFGFTYHANGTFIGPEDPAGFGGGGPGNPKPPLPDNQAPPAGLPDSLLSSTSPRLYPASGDIANVSGTTGHLISDYYNSVRMEPAAKLGFKHLGGIMFFKLGEVPSGSPQPAQPGAGFGGWNMDSDDTLEDPEEWKNLEDRRWSHLFRPRSILELTLLNTVTISHDTGNRYTAAPGTFLDGWVGFYVRVGTSPNYERYEITDVEPGGGAATIDTRDDTPGVAAGSVQVFGTRGDYTQVTFFPDLLADTDNVGDLTGVTERGPFNIPYTVEVTISPTTKTARIPAGQGGTISSAISALKNPANGDYDYPDNKYQHASFHCIFKEQTGFNGKITIQSRTRFFQDDAHLLSVSGMFFRTRMFLPPVGAGLGAALPGQTGAAATTISYSQGILHVGGLTGMQIFSSIGNYLRLSSAAHAGNNGTFRIVAVNGPNDVLVRNSAGFAVDTNSGSIVWSEIGKAAGHMDTLPGPDPLQQIEDSGHEVFGFGIAQKVDSTLDPYLSVEELASIVTDNIAGAQAEIVETDVFTGTLNVLATTFDVQDPTANFTTMGAGFGYLIELLEGDNAGIYFVESASGDTLSLSRPPDKSSDGFVGNETGIGYRLFTQQLLIYSLNAGPGSSIEVTDAPSQFGFGTLPYLAEGVCPGIEAVNADGDNLDLSGLSAGDASGGLVVTAADGSVATIDGGVASSLAGLRFSFDGSTEGALALLLTNLQTIRDSRTLLGKNGFDQDLTKLDAAMSALVTPGQAFQADQNRVRVLLADLLSVLTSNYRRISEYSATIPQTAYQIEDVISSYTAPRVDALDALLDSLNEYGFDRALVLLITGRIKDFFDTTAATASFAGNLLEAGKKVAADIPKAGILQADVAERVNTSDAFEDDVDADKDFSDADEKPLDTL